MKARIALTIFTLAASVSAANPQRTPGAAIPFADRSAALGQKPESGGSRMLWISATGDDSAAARGDRNRPWRTIYGIHDASNHVYYGAATVARAGDWIVFEPGTHRAPAIPLNLPGNGGPKGVNLLVPRGATIIRTNFTDQRGAVLPAGLLYCGPLIIPGNGSKVIIEGTVIATNDASFDAAFGWMEGLPQPGFPPQDYGFRNFSATDVVLGGHGTLVGWSDVIYVYTSQTGTPRRLQLRDVHLRSRWDCCFFSGNNSVQTRKIDAYAEASMGSRASHGIVVLRGGTWNDRESVFAASGTEWPGDHNAAAYVLFDSTNRFAGTTLVAYGTTNVVPFISVESLSSGWYFSYGFGTNHLGRVKLDRGK